MGRPPFAPSRFRPAWWLPGAHLQTLGARFLRSWLRVPFRRERVELPDGDFLDLDFAYPRSRSAGDARPIAVVLHGLEGSARAGYARVIHRALRDDGIAGVGLNFRSCSGELNRLPRFYHSGDTDDLRRVLDLLVDRHPGRPVGAIGVSIGGNVLLKFLGEAGSGSCVAAAAAISAPYDLSAGADYMLGPRGRLYNAYLLRSLRRKLEAKRPILPPGIDVAAAVGARSFRAFDDAATAPLHGFSDAEDYYRQSSSARFLGEIRTPTLLVHALDDPFLPPESVPVSAVEANPHLVAAFQPCGGHVGFVSGRSPLSPVFWAEREAVAFVSGRLARTAS
jgi:predicted alpha/beta-fold hydrolase